MQLVKREEEEFGRRYTTSSTLLLYLLVEIEWDSCATMHTQKKRRIYRIRMADVDLWLPGCVCMQFILSRIETSQRHERP